MTSEMVIDLLVKKTKRDKNFSRLLIAFLRKAKEIAQKNLNPTLFKALPWPTDLVNMSDTYSNFQDGRPNKVILISGEILLPGGIKN